MYPLSSLTGRRISAALLAAGVTFTPLAVQASPSDPTDEPTLSTTEAPTPEPSEPTPSATLGEEVTVEPTPGEDGTDVPSDTPTSTSETPSPEPRESEPAPSDTAADSVEVPAVDAPAEQSSPSIQTFSAVPESTPSFAIVGAMRGYWDETGGQGSWLGDPTSNEQKLSGGGYVQHFENADLYWSPGNGGAHAVYRGAAFETLWKRSGHTRGWLGYPSTDEIRVPGGVMQKFTGGTLYFDFATKNVWSTKGAIGGHYESLGGPKSWLGLPTQNEIKIRGGYLQRFQHGIAYYSPGAGTHSISRNGAIFGIWARHGYEHGELGFPTSQEYAVRGGRAQNFQNGTIYWNSRTGVTEATKNAIHKSYNGIGGPNSALGLPRSGEIKLNNGVTIQYFEGGNMYWHPRTGAYAVHSGMLNQYAKRGYERGFLGLPTSNEYTYKGQYRQNFENGVLYWTRSNGTGVVGWEPANPYYFGPTNNPTTSRGGHNLTKGWNGVRVAAVQKRLGIYSNGHSATMNAKTIRAVKSWQRKRGLPVTGVVDKRTWDSLGTGVSWYADGFTVKPKVSITASRQERIDTMVNFARSQVGSPYTWGGAGGYNLGYDCSGIAIQAMNAAGLETGVTPEQHAGANWLSTHYFYNSKKFRKVPISKLQRGDWIFYRDSGGTIRHMTMYLGNGQMLHSWGPGVHIRSYTRNLPGRTADPYVLRPF
ncbi:NlpC/P60 family protein [Dermabacter vaginalis]|uniref:NlpC/P60 family protein n=1 Tax=Dermabacter vaginalis TaxID=1630135 RepID=UPI0021A8E58D|nr:NlpC/P60 family protein [Dermabacter vaginalis]MCT2149892.1 NlpC/P60 family protein [Dermabacter vaginalis]